MPATNVSSAWVSGNLVFYDKDGNIIVTYDGTNRKLTLPSGSTLESLGTTTITDGSLSAADLALATGSILLGTANKAAALDVKADGAILIGNGTTAAMQTLDTDVTMTNTGAVTIANDAITTAKILNGAVTAAKLANGAGVAALFTAGAGASAAYAKTTNGAQVLATGTAGTKKVFIFVTVTEAFADAGGNQPTFTIGEVGTADKFSDAALLTGATLNTVKVLAGELTASTNMIVTGVPAVGEGTGAISVAAIILPATT